MPENKLTSANAIVFHITTISKSWTLKNPYFKALKALLLDTDNLTLDRLRLQREYHFIEKMIRDEVNKENRTIGNNVKNIEDLIGEYIESKRQSSGDKIIQFLFAIFLLKLFNKNIHFSMINESKIREFLRNYFSEDSNYFNFKKILSFVYSVEIIQRENIVGDYDLSLSLLYKKLLMTNTAYRNKEILIDYYIKQNKIENLDITNITSERNKGRILEIALILKATNGKGLYLPNIEKEQYLSQYTKDIFREKYQKILKSIYSWEIKKKNITTPIYVMVFSLFLIETLIFILPSFFESISLGFVDLNTQTISNLPTWLVIIINGVLISALLYYLERKTNQKISDDKWQ